MAEDSKNEVPAINRSIGSIFKAMEKLQKLGVLCNFSYCLPSSGTIYTHGWHTIEDIIMKDLDSANNSNFNEIVQKDLDGLHKERSNREPRVILGSLPLALDANRDQLRPLLIEMVRVSQSKGYASKRIQYRKDGEKVQPPTWWPDHVKFEGISDVMVAENIRDAYEAGRSYYLNKNIDGSTESLNDSSAPTSPSPARPAATMSAQTESPPPRDSPSISSPSVNPIAVNPSIERQPHIPSTPKSSVTASDRVSQRPSLSSRIPNPISSYRPSIAQDERADRSHSVHAVQLKMLKQQQRQGILNRLQALEGNVQYHETRRQDEAVQAVQDERQTNKENRAKSKQGRPKRKAPEDVSASPCLARRKAKRGANTVNYKM